MICKWLLPCILYCFLFTGCGLSTEISDSSSDDSSGDETTIERAVDIIEVNTNSTGTIVHCDLNDIFKDIDEDIPVFIEFDGVEIQRKVFPSGSARVPFQRYNPPEDGNIVCVIVYADAEFESEPLYIEAQD